MSSEYVSDVNHKEATKVLLMSLLGLLITAVIQAVVVVMSGSIGLLADTIHNFGDAFTSIPLWIAFVLGSRQPTKRFPYGLGRSEDLAGLFILATISASAVAVGYESITRFVHPTTPTHFWAVAAAALVGFLGNELAAILRIRFGKKIGSAALVTDGRHAQLDGLSSLAVIPGVIGAQFGVPLFDPIVGILLTAMILTISIQSAKTIFTRLLDGIEPETIDQIRESALAVEGVCQATDIRARWVGHTIYVKVDIVMDSRFSITQGHDIAKGVMHRLKEDIVHVGNIDIQMSPCKKRHSLQQSQGCAWKNATAQCDRNHLETVSTDLA